MKKIYLAASILLIASCSFDQKPAPYEVYGSKYYGKSSRVTSGGAHPVYHNDDLDPSNPNYNSQIDAHNSSHASTRPIGGTQPSHSQSLAPTTSSGGISARPLGEAAAIDGNEQVVKLNSGKTLVHSGASTTAYDFQKDRKESNYVAHEETVPPVENTDNYVNPSEQNKDRNADEKLGHLKPLPRPAMPKEVAVVDNSKTKITPKIKKVETNVSAPKSTIGVIDKKDEMDDQQDEIEENEDEPAETVAVPVKKIAVPAEKVVDNEAAKNKRETTIAAQKAVKRQVETVPPVEKPAVVEKAEPEKEVVEIKPEVESTPTATAKPKSQFIKPVDGTVVSEFGGDSAGGGFNDGISIQAPEGTPVKAASGGTVVYSGNQLQGYGNMVIVKHNNGFLTAYSHLKGLEVKKGDQVNQSDVIGHVGKTGNITSPQLHFGIRKGREPVDPKDYL